MDTWVVNLRHFLDPKGSFAPKSGPALRLAQHFAAIVQELSADLGEVSSVPKVQCRRRPNRKRCTGTIESLLDPESGQILWKCPVCGDDGSIAEWEGTFWDLSDLPEKPLSG